ncbi:DUF2063 domain-containing protein [bacterium]|nr:MAG: DUF2063 domain-containing protein [bacterium]
MTMPLKDLQRRFSDALLHVGAEDGFLQLVTGGDAQRSRLALYRGNLMQTWHKVLSAAYPVLHEMVGEDCFVALTRVYGPTYPSCSGDLNRFGRHMSELLRAWPPCSAYPYLADLACLEWAVHRAYFAADKTSLSPEDWLQYTPDVLEGSGILLHPAVELVSSRWNIADIWYGHQLRESTLSEMAVARPQHVIIGRPWWIPIVIPVSSAGLAALVALRGGATLGGAIDTALAQDEQFDFASNWRTWVDHAIVVEPIRSAR